METSIFPRRNLGNVKAPLKVPTRPNPPFRVIRRGNPENPDDEYVLSTLASCGTVLNKHPINENVRISVRVTELPRRVGKKRREKPELERRYP